MGPLSNSVFAQVLLIELQEGLVLVVMEVRVMRAHLGRFVFLGDLLTGSSSSSLLIPREKAWVWPDIK